MTNRTPAPAHLTADVATERQVAFISDLMDRKNLFAEPTFFDRFNAMDAGELAAVIAKYKADVKGVTKARASQIIDSLLKLPDEEQQAERQQRSMSVDVEAGRYCIERPGPVHKFYRVDRPKDGRWKGYTFVKVQASEDYYPVKGAEAKNVLEQIATEPQEAMRRYGQLLGQCGRCGRTLTDETSREIGIGPVCRAEMEI